MGQLVRMRKFPDPTFVEVTAPNADTLYTSGWFDVTKEPWILSLPDSHGRYYLMPMLDGWTNVFSGPRHAHHGQWAANLRDHRTGMERNLAEGRNRIQVTNRHGLAPRTDLLDRNA